MKNKVLIIGGLLLLLVGGLVLRTLHRGGVFLTLQPHGPPVLRTITGFPGGSEDLEILPGTHKALVSSADFRDPSVAGGIFLVDLDAGTSRDVTPKLEFQFQPHGLSLWTAADGTMQLFVVNHRGGSGFTHVANDVVAQHSIDVFSVATEGTLKYLRSHESPQMNSPNDVAAIGANAFYVTNDHGYGPGFARTLEDYLQLGLGNVVYFDGSEYREVHSGTKYANGITATRDGATVYLAETIGGRVTKFSRDASSGALTMVTQTDWVSGLDNIAIDTDGSVWVAGHPKLLTFVEHAKAPEVLSPTQVLRFTFGAPGEWSVEEIYLSDGKPLSAATITTPVDGMIALGAAIQGAVVVLGR